MKPATLRAVSALLKAKICAIPTPVAVSWLLTTRCTNVCPYCEIPQQSQPELPTKTLLRMVQALRKANACRVLFTGGEPLLREDLPELIIAASESGIQTGVITNGVLLDKKLHQLLALDEITVSFDGNRGVMDSIRGRGCYEAAYESARSVSATGIPLKLSVVLSRRNLNQIDFLVALAEELQAIVYFQPTETHALYSQHSNPLLPNALHYRTAIDHLILLKKTHSCIGNSLPGLMYLKRWPGPAPIECLGGLLFVRIESDGSVRICGRRTHQQLCFDGTQDFREIMSKLCPPSCDGCWGASRVELYHTYKLNPGAMLNMFRLR